MASEARVSKREHVELAGDGLLITAGMFALLTALGLAVLAATGDTLGDTAGTAAGVGIVTSLLTLAGGIAGPVVAWRLHGRRVTVAAVLGGFVGAAAGGAATMLLIGLSWPLGWLVSPISKSEFAGPIALLVLVSAAFVAITVWMVVDAVRDWAPGRREHPRLDIARFASALVLVAFGALVVVLMTRPAGGEFGEAFIFAYAAGLGGAAIVAGADAVTTLAERGKGGAPTVSTPEAPA